MKIRIGNDINLTVNLLGSKNIDAVNLQSVNAYLINKTKYEDLDLVQNISRNFTDMKLMRDRVVNKTYCEPL